MSKGDNFVRVTATEYGKYSKYELRIMKYRLNMRNHLRMLMKSISLISFTLLLIGCQSKINDELIQISVNKKTRYYYECNLEVIYNKDSIVVKVITNDSINTNESLLVLKRQNESFVLVSNKVLMRNDNKLINKEILSIKNFHYSVFDTLTPLNDTYKIDVYNYRRGEEFISTISQYYRPQSMIRIYYNKDFRIHRVKIVFGVDEFVFESSKYKMDTRIDEKTIVYPKFLNDMKRDSLEFIKENQYDDFGFISVRVNCNSPLQSGSTYAQTSIIRTVGVFAFFV